MIEYSDRWKWSLGGAVWISLPSILIAYWVLHNAYSVVPDYILNQRLGVGTPSIIITGTALWYILAEKPEKINLYRGFFVGLLSLWVTITIMITIDSLQTMVALSNEGLLPTSTFSGIISILVSDLHSIWEESLLFSPSILTGGIAGSVFAYYRRAKYDSSTNTE